jgi:hypothetical protein
MRGLPGRLGIVAVAALIAGCGISVGGPSNASSDAPSALPIAAQSASVSVAASPSIAHSPTPTAAKDAVTTINDPDLSLRLPAGWRSLPLAMARSQAEQVSAVMTGAIKEAYEQLIVQIDANEVRLFAAGPTGVDPWQGTLVVEVTDVRSAEEQIARILKLQTAIAKATTSERSTVKLVIGSGVRLEQTAEAPSDQGVAARAINYVVELDDGRIMWINSTGPAASKTFAALIDGAVATISSR